ncbi:hypothetical protein ACFL35_10475 [Candidatus Riflebacteria bacterium]
MKLLTRTLGLISVFMLLGIASVQSLEIDKFATLAHELEIKTAVLNREMKMIFSGDPYSQHFLKYVEEFAIASHKLHKLAEKWYITGVGLGLRMDSMEYLAEQIQFAAVHTHKDMRVFRDHWKEIKVVYLEILRIYRGQNTAQYPTGGGSLAPLPNLPGSVGNPISPNPADNARRPIVAPGGSKQIMGPKPQLPTARPSF